MLTLCYCYYPLFEVNTFPLNVHQLEYSRDITVRKCASIKIVSYSLFNAHVMRCMNYRQLH